MSNWTMPRVGAAVLLLALAGCGDRQIATAEYQGRAAMASGHTMAAVREYRAALQRARANDDGAQIAKQGTNLAIAELADNQLDQSVTDARELQAELAKRGRTPPRLLDLVIATALYRKGDMAQARPVAAKVAADSGTALALRGQFLVGLIADAQHDQAGLLAASLVLAGEHDQVSVADATELKARLDLARGDARSAQSLALDAVKLRSELRDERGAARCDALAGDAAVTANARADAAGLYLKAGQGAAAIGDDRNARGWLEKAKSMAADPEIAREAALALANLSS